ncbi:MAG: type II toxin-antitoxin system HicB family antitoxin [Ktedonobacterales bacterium]
MKYSMVIKWSDDDDAYLVLLPEWAEGPITDGPSYAEAAQKGADVLDTFIEITKRDGRPLPQPGIYAA